jgi:lysophospholipase
MLVGQQGYVPEPHFLTETLRSQTRFHDPLQDSLFSNSGSVQGFRDWSRGTSPSASPRRGGISTPAMPSLLPTLLVRSSHPIGQSSTLSLDQVQRKQPTCVQVSENIYEAHLPSLVTPRSAVPGSNARKSIRYAILEVNNFSKSEGGGFNCYSGLLFWIAAIWRSKA